MTVTTADMKAHLEIEHDEDDTILVGFVDAASAWIVRYCGLDAMPDPMPADLSLAVRQLAAHYYAHRGVGSDPVHIPASVYSLAAPYYDWAV